MIVSQGNYQLQTLGDLCEINPRKPDLRTLPDDTPVLFVPMAAVDEVTGTITNSQTRTLGEVRNKSYRTFAPGDILFAKITPCMENGKSAIVPPIASGIGFGSTEFHVLRPKDGTDPRLIWHFVRQDVLRREARENMTGSVGQARVPASFLDPLPVQLPAGDHQASLADLLDASTSSARRANDHLNRSVSALDRFRHSVLLAACSGRLTSDWRDKNPTDPVPTPPPLTKQATANASSAPNANDLLEAPETWKWWPLEAITEQVIDYRGRTPPSENQGPIPHVRTTHIREGKVDWEADRFITQETYNRYMTRGIPQRGDVLFTMEAPMGEVGFIDSDEPFSLAQRILLLRPGEHITGEYLAIALRSNAVRRAIEYRATGTGVLGIAYKRLRSVVVPVPPIEEQREIARQASQLMAKADEVAQTITPVKRIVEKANQAIHTKAFRGELQGDD